MGKWFLAALTATCLLSSAQAQSSKSKAVKATPEDYARLRNVKQFSGRISFVDPIAMVLALRVEIPHVERNPNYRPPRVNVGNNYNLQRQLVDLQRRQQQALRNRNPAQRRQQLMQVAAQMQRLRAQAQREQLRAMQQLAQASRQAVKVVTTPKDYDFVIRETADVRKMFVGTEYDDQGFIKEYTPDQLAKLRGNDRSKPGYAAELDDVQPGQGVTLYLVPPTEPDGRPTVRMIVMTREPTAN